MGLFDRLFGRKKQEPPIEEVVKEALENIDELEEETAPVPEAGENLEAEAVQSYQDEQQLDDQVSDIGATGLILKILIIKGIFGTKIQKRLKKSKKSLAFAKKENKNEYNKN